MVALPLPEVWLPARNGLLLSRRYGREWAFGCAGLERNALLR